MCSNPRHRNVFHVPAENLWYSDLLGQRSIWPRQRRRAVYGGTGRLYCTDCWANHNDATDPFHFDDADQQSDFDDANSQSLQRTRLMMRVSVATFVEAFPVLASLAAVVASAVCGPLIGVIGTLPFLPLPRPKSQQKLTPPSVTRNQPTGIERTTRWGKSSVYWWRAVAGAAEKKKERENSSTRQTI